MQQNYNIPGRTITGNLLDPKNIHPSWEPLLTDDFLKKVADVETELNHMPVQECGYAYFPEKKNIFRFLSSDLENVKYVILGMEPYPSWYTDKDGVIRPVATGRSFEIGNVDSWTQKYKQSSLRNILKTIYYDETGKKAPLEQIREEITSGEFRILPPHEWFDNLEKQGVLFLNSTLTVKPGESDSHTYIWEDVMRDVIRFINSYNLKGKATWLLFGNCAKEKMNSVVEEGFCLYSCHPRLARFVDEDIFYQTNGIKWTGDFNI